jgi:hypothetical protein
VWGGGGHDDLIAFGDATVYGQTGNDKLYGTYCDGGAVEQNNLAQDPSYGYYGSTTTGITLTNGNWGGGTTTTQRIEMETKSLGPAGWLSSGAWDVAQNKFVPPPMNAQARRAVGRMIVQIPAGWALDAMSFARDEIIWYRVSGPAVAAPSNRAVGAGGAWFYNSAGMSVTVAGATVPSTAVPTLDGSVVAVPNTTDALLDGVNAGKHRFLGVKRGTVLIGGAGSTVADVAQHYVSIALLPTRSTQQIRLAGYTRTFTPAADVIDSVPPGGPKVRGILVNGGAIWLPTDGTEPYFSSGTK